MKPKKNKRITIRITEAQFERLAEKLIEENETKSLYLRNIIETDLAKRNSI
jgi:predicted DNA binding CopG/RHH family protein